MKVKLASSSVWPHLVAVLSALTPNHQAIVVSEGGTRTSTLTRKFRAVTIPLIETAALIPPGSRLRLILAGASTAQSIVNAVYLDIGMPASAKLKIGRATLRLPVLKKVVSRQTEG